MCACHGAAEAVPQQIPEAARGSRCGSACRPRACSRPPAHAEAGQLPSLRWTLFCGEALPADIVTRSSRRRRPASVVENLYGPTELTIACTLYRWRGDASLAECAHGVVPIGEPYPGMRAIVVDEALAAVPRGEAGELLLAGVQVTPGYWQDAERTAKAFVVPPGETEVFYRTGDRVRWPDGGPLLYLGRVDSQVKIQGYRVDPGEIEAVLRDVGRTEVAIALGWPLSTSGADGVVGFVQAPHGASAEAREALGRTLVEASKARLPNRPQPSRVLLVDEWPLNANGKVDRNALRAVVDAEAAAVAAAKVRAKLRERWRRLPGEGSAPAHGRRGVNRRWVIKKAARGAVTFGSLASGSLALRGAIARGPRVRVLTYHRVGDACPEDPFCVTRDAFDAQMRLLAEEGRAVSLQQVQRFVAGREVLPDGACLVTIDDGCLSTLSEVLPTLRRWGVPAVAFVSASIVGADYDGLPERFLTWDELRTLDEARLSPSGRTRTRTARWGSWRPATHAKRRSARARRWNASWATRCAASRIPSARAQTSTPSPNVRWPTRATTWRSTRCTAASVLGWTPSACRA
ncbi:MAG: AMP-binding protein [Sandaracinaceae bacterium]|nr:AMP-binding protein [Sandaracinaceae bacterium]